MPLDVAAETIVSLFMARHPKLSSAFDLRCQINVWCRHFEPFTVDTDPIDIPKTHTLESVSAVDCCTFEHPDLPGQGRFEVRSYWWPARGPSHRSPAPASYWLLEDDGSPSAHTTTHTHTLCHWKNYRTEQQSYCKARAPSALPLCGAFKNLRNVRK